MDGQSIPLPNPQGPGEAWGGMRNRSPFTRWMEIPDNFSKLGILSRNLSP